MTLPTSGPLTFADIQTEFGGSNPIGLNEYYAGGAYVAAGTTGTYGAVPSSGQIGVQNFYGTSAGPPPPTTIGQAYAGGYYAGQIGVSGVATHYLVVGPVASAQNNSKEYKNANTSVTGADSVINGPQNTADMVAEGNSTVYPAAHFCNDLVIGGYSDWYMPAKNELEVCYYNLKPTTQLNSTSSGINANAVPARASNYTILTPGQTSASAFKDTGAEDFAIEAYWSSTEFSATAGWRGSFSTGYQFDTGKSNAGYVRAIRRVPV